MYVAPAATVACMTNAPSVYPIMSYAHHAQAVAAGAEIISPPTDMDYGSREYAARDPEGNIWSFGTHRPTPA